MYCFFYIFVRWSVVKLTGLCGRSVAALSAYVDGLGSLLGPMLAVLGRPGASVGGPWVAPGAYVGGLEPLLEPMLAVLGRSWGLCRRSWAVLGREVAQTQAAERSGKRIWAEKWPKPERERDPQKGPEA